MKSARYLVKYNRHSGEYGIHDRASGSTRWRMDKAAAASQVARMNAMEAIGGNLNAAIVNLSTALTGVMTAERRAKFRALREQLRSIRDALPTCDDLTCEIQHDHSLPTLPRTME